MQTRIGYIYEIRNSLNGKRYYGQTTDKVRKRWTEHLRQLNRTEKGHHSVALQRAWDKYGSASFVFSVLWALPIAWLDEVETALIQSGKAARLCYNSASFADSSGRGRVPSENTRAKMSLAKLGKKRSPDFCLNHSLKMKGRKINWTPEWRAKIRAAQEHTYEVLDEVTGLTTTVSGSKAVAVLTGTTLAATQNAIRRGSLLGKRFRVKDLSHRARTGY